MKKSNLEITRKEVKNINSLENNTVILKVRIFQVKEINQTFAQSSLKILQVSPKSKYLHLNSNLKDK